jgi:large subunit ribosomal protein L23
MNKLIHQILIKPLITEKVTETQEQKNLYGFVVALDANKIEIANAVEKKFNVDVVKVRTIRNKGKTKTQFTRRGRFTGRSSKFKKAYVILKEGQKIDLFENV